MTELASTIDTVRVSLHVLAASIWLGGQFVVGGVVSSLRGTHRDALPLVARAFGRLAWPAFAVLVLTGMWSLAVIDVTATSSGYQEAVFAKVLTAIAAGAAAAIHSYGSTRAAKALGGAAAALLSVVALVLGVLMSAGA